MFQQYQASVRAGPKHRKILSVPQLSKDNHFTREQQKKKETKKDKKNGDGQVIKSQFVKSHSSYEWILLVYVKLSINRFC